MKKPIAIALPIALVGIGIAIAVAISARKTAGPDEAPTGQSRQEDANSGRNDNGTSGSAYSAIASGTIQVAPELTDRSKQIGVVYVMLRSQAGGPPYAVSRLDNPRNGEPIAFTLTAENVMAQGTEMPTDAKLVVRFDADGSAGPEMAGDLVGEAAVEAVGKSDIAVLVNREGQAQ